MAGYGSLLPRAAVEQKLGISTATLYRWMDQGIFPRPIKLGPNSVRWSEAKIVEWIASREANSTAA